MSVTLELPQTLQDAYNNVAKEQGSTKEELMRQALEAYLEDLEDLAIALKGREDRLNGEKGTPAEEVFKKLGI